MIAMRTDTHQKVCLVTVLSHLQGGQQALTHQLLGSCIRDKSQASQHLQAGQLALVLGTADEGQHGCHHTALYDLSTGYCVMLPQQTCTSTLYIYIYIYISFILLKIKLVCIFLK